MNSSPDKTIALVAEGEPIRIASDFEDEDGRHPIIEVDPDYPGLFLVDIDNTLVDSKQIHGPALIALFRERFGDKIPSLKFGDEYFERELLDHYESLWGLGDRQEFELLCEQYGITFSSEQEKRETLDALVQDYGIKMEESLRRIGSDEEKRTEVILPGAIDFLEEMKRRGIPAALVTGNSRRSARAFVKYLGFGKYFITGGFDDDPDVSNEPYRRANILKSALRKCKNKGLPLPKNIGVFGDTVKDFKATTFGTGGAKPYVFLLATGTDTVHDLSRARSEEDGRRISESDHVWGRGNLERATHASILHADRERHIPPSYRSHA